jgi:hypothetical protein
MSRRAATPDIKVYAVVNGKRVSAHGLTKSAKPSMVYASSSKNYHDIAMRKVKQLEESNKTALERLEQSHR